MKKRIVLLGLLLSCSTAGWAQDSGEMKEQASDRSNVVAAAERKRAEMLQAEADALRASVARNTERTDPQTRYVYRIVDWYFHYLALEHLVRERCADDRFSREWVDRDVERRFYRGAWFFAQLAGGVSQCGIATDLKAPILRQVEAMLEVGDGVIRAGSEITELERFRADEKLTDEDEARLKRIGVEPLFSFDAGAGGFHRKLVYFLMTGDGIITPPVSLDRSRYKERVLRLLEDGFKEVNAATMVPADAAPEYLKFWAEVLVPLGEREAAIKKYEELLVTFPLYRGFAEAKTRLEILAAVERADPAPRGNFPSEEKNIEGRRGVR